MVVCFDNNSVTSSLHIGIPHAMLGLVERFAAGEMVKIKCELGYKDVECFVYLKAKSIEVVSNARVVVN